MPNTVNKQSIIALSIALLVLVSALGFTIQSLVKAYSTPTEQASSPINLAATKVNNTGKGPDVMGITDINTSCTDAKDYLKRIAIFTPEVVVRFGTEQKTVSATRILSCQLSLTQTEVNAEGCMEYSLSIDDNCIERLLTTSYRFAEPAESVRNPTTGKSVETRISDEIVNYSLLADQITDAFQKNTRYATVTSRYALIRSPELNAPSIKDSPNTDGSIANRYIEFDGSRQLMFLWTSGKYEKFRISGAFPEYNPIGMFEILNKSPLAWSSTANKWMPYWQAFAYDKKQRAMLGIHALVYWYPGLKKTGTKKIFEPETNIGIPRSTGCLRLTVADAKKVFEWSKVGDIVVVHD